MSTPGTANIPEPDIPPFTQPPVNSIVTGETDYTHAPDKKKDMFIDPDLSLQEWNLPEVWNQQFATLMHVFIELSLSLDSFRFT